MQRWIRDENIRRFRAALSSGLAPEQRAMIETLLVKELAAQEMAQQTSCGESLNGALASRPRALAIREAFPAAGVPADEND